MTAHLNPKLQVSLLTAVRFVTAALRVAGISTLPYILLQEDLPRLVVLAGALLALELLDGLAEKSSSWILRLIEDDLSHAVFVHPKLYEDGADAFRDGLVSCALRGTSLTDVQRLVLLWATPVTAVALLARDGNYWPVLCLAGSALVLWGLVDGPGRTGTFLASRHEKHNNQEHRTRNNLVGSKYLKLLLANGTRGQAERSYAASQAATRPMAQCWTLGLTGGGLLVACVGLSGTVTAALPASIGTVFFPPILIVFLFLGVTRITSSVDAVLRVLELHSVAQSRRQSRAEKTRDTAQDPAPEQAGPSVTVQNLKHRYPGSSWELRLGSWTIHPEQRWLVQGKNGAGKSTLLKILAGQISPQHGRFSLRGPVYYQQQTIPPLLGALGEIVPTASSPTPVLASYFSASAVLQRIVRNSQPGGELSFRVPGSDTTLSPGEAQVLLLARAVSWAEQNPHGTILLDEPLSALDVDESRIALEHLCQVKSAVVLVNHMGESCPGLRTLQVDSTKVGLQSV